jgi:hypothetical protein
MNTSITNNDEQQLIPMAILSPAVYLQNENQIIINSNDIIKSEIKQENFFKNLFSCPTNIFRFSDRSLRITFLLFITFIGITSFTIALIIGSSTVQFKQQCPLYASFKYIKESNSTIKIIPTSARFSSQSTCDFCTFYNVFTFIYCIMTGFFFVLFNGDQRIVTTNDRCLIMPW